MEVDRNFRIKFFITIALISTVAFSQEQGQEAEASKKKDKVNFGGQAEIGLDVKAPGWIGNGSWDEGKLTQIGKVETELKIRPADSVELEFDLEYDRRFTNLNLEKLFLRYNFDNSNARIGYMKKMFTLEEIKNSKDNLFAKKSMLNDILEDFFLLGHDFTAQYRYIFPAHTLIGAYSMDGGSRSFVNLTAISQITEKTKGIAAVMYEIYRIKEGGFKYDNAFFGNLGLEFDGEITDFEAEGVFGQNPEKYGAVHIDGLEYDDGGYFWGIRFQQSFPLALSGKHLNMIIPLYEISQFNDSFDFKTAYWQTRAGVNLCFTPKNRLQWRTNFDLVITARNQDSNSPQIVNQRVTSEILVLW